MLEKSTLSDVSTVKSLLLLFNDILPIISEMCQLLLLQASLYFLTTTTKIGSELVPLNFFV